ncbi:MAG TPA: hypothetical protein VMZ30_09905 [Pyrinomonadaceae bacterium]|nr:hypothetical protein [Pyrinomonadaceae bacterium]
MMRTRALFVSIFVLSIAVTQLSGGTQPLSADVVFASGPEEEEHGGQITSRYDGFNNETVVTLKKMKVTCAGKRGNFKDACVSIMAALHCPGIQLDYVRHVTLQLVFETKDWDQRHPLDQRELSVVANAETLRLGRMELLAQKVDTLMSETLQIKVPYAVFKKMALAETVELQVGASRFELREKNLSALRDLNNRVKFAQGMRSAN